MSYEESIIHLKTMKIRNDILVITRFKDFSVKIVRGKETITLSPQEMFVDWVAKEYGEREAWGL